MTFTRRRSSRGGKRRRTARGGLLKELNNLFSGKNKKPLSAKAKHCASVASAPVVSAPVVSAPVASKSPTTSSAKNKHCAASSKGGTRKRSRKHVRKHRKTGRRHR